MSEYGTKEYNEKFGERLRNLMYREGKTATEMAKDLKISKGSISNWTTGKRLPRAGAMDAICRYLGCTRADLLEDVPQTTPQTVQEPAEGARDVDLGLVCDAIVSAGYGHLEALFRAAAGADEKSIAFVTGILERNQKKITT